jgi:biotin carboxyl carrier protein
MISIVGGKRIRVEGSESDRGKILVDGYEHEAHLLPLGGSSFSLLLDNESFDVWAEERDGLYFIHLVGETYEVRVEDERTALAALAAGRERTKEHLEVKAPMPGMVVAVRVESGQKVRRHQGLVILEAMKMENEIRAPRDGSVREVRVETGQAVEKNQVLVILD